MIELNHHIKMLEIDQGKPRDRNIFETRKETRKEF